MVPRSADMLMERTRPYVVRYLHQPLWLRNEEGCVRGCFRGEVCQRHVPGGVDEVWL